jgi:hypothetical protein
MLNNIEKDERTMSVENQSYRIGYLILDFGILIDIMYRAFMFNESAWDLFGIIFLGGIVTTIYQCNNKILTKNWVKSTVLISLLSAFVAVAMVILFKLYTAVK